MLDTAFPRILGDAGNIQSYECPARVHVVLGADSPDIVKDGAIAKGLAEKFCIAAKTLETQGAIALISTCGFLVTAQPQIARAVNIPVMVSALSLYSVIQTTIGAAPIGILTASSASLGEAALQAAGIARENVRISGMEDCTAFASAILNKKSSQTGFDAREIERAAVEKAMALVSATPAMGAILLECGNLPPYAPAISKATGLPVYSILDGARLLWNAASKHQPLTGRL